MYCITSDNYFGNKFIYFVDFHLKCEAAEKKKIEENNNKKQEHMV